MQDLFPEIEVNEANADAIARGLLAVAHADGELLVREEAMIMEFYAGLHDNPSDLASLQRDEAIVPADLAAQLPTLELQMLFLKTAYLLALADNELSDAEQATISGFADAFGLSGELERTLGEVKEFMLAQLTHLQNAEGVAEVAKELKV